MREIEVPYWEGVIVFNKLKFDIFFYFLNLVL